MAFNMTHYIVTGGCGFIGSHLVEALAAMECYVTVVDDKRNGEHIVQSNYVQYLHCAVEDVEFDDTTPQIDGIIHLANTPRVRLSMEEPADSIMNNVGPTVAVCEWARRWDCPIFFAQSSSRLQGTPYANPYTFGKTLAEETLRLYKKLYQVQSHLLYFYNVYGPREADYGEHSTVVRAFKNQIKKGEPLHIYGNGRKERDFTYVTDVVTGIVKLLLTHEGKRPPWIHLGAGNPKTILEIAEAFEHPFVFEFDRKGEVEKTKCELPYIKAEFDVIEYIQEWKVRQ